MTTSQFGRDPLKTPRVCFGRALTTAWGQVLAMWSWCCAAETADRLGRVVGGRVVWGSWGLEVVMFGPDDPLKTMQFCVCLFLMSRAGYGLNDCAGGWKSFVLLDSERRQNGLEENRKNIRQLLPGWIRVNAQGQGMMLHYRILSATEEEIIIKPFLILTG